MRTIINIETLKNNSNLTVAELLTKIEEADAAEVKLEEDAKNKIKEEFEGAYLKVIDHHGLFGKTLKIYHVKAIPDTTRCTDWTIQYFVNGTYLWFAETEMNVIEMKGSNTQYTFSEKEFRAMTVISKDDFDGYMFTFEQLKATLTNIINHE